MNMTISENFDKQDNYIIEKFSRHEDLQNEMFSRHKLQTVSTFSNLESSLKTMSDRVDVVTSLVEGLISTLVVNSQPTVSSELGIQIFQFLISIRSAK